MGLRAWTLVTALALAAPTRPAIAAPGGLGPLAEDRGAGWSMRPPEGWVARPPRAPGDRSPIVAGWYHPDGRAHGEILLVVLGDALAPADATLERGFPEWLEAWSQLVELDGTGRLTWEGRSTLRAEETRRGRLVPAKDGLAVRLLARFTAAPGFHAGVVVTAPEARWTTLLDMAARSLRRVDRDLVRRQRGDAENRSGRARTSGDAHAERVLAALPRDWGSRRTRRYLLVHDGRVPRDLVARLAVLLESARSQLYERRFGAPPAESDVGVVKVVASREQYLAYGAPPESAAYWSPSHRELVLVWTDGGEEKLIGSMLHEGFHQFMHVWTAGLLPHRWFDEGYAEVYESIEVRGSGLGEPGATPWKEQVAEQVRNGSLPALGPLLRMEQAEFYGPGGSAMLRHYGAAWSFVDFLEGSTTTLRRRFPDRYLRALRDVALAWRAEYEAQGIETPDVIPDSHGAPLRARALEQALGRLDVAALEKAWRESLR